jgi:hypothetical protein
MNDQSPPDLPIRGHGFDSDESCANRAYVTLEEKALLAAMRKIREQAVSTRRQMQGLDDSDARSRLEDELEELRGRWTEIAARREDAYRRKMIMLGHIDPDD